MARRSALARRSPAEWGVRILLAVAAGVLGYAAVTHAMATALESRLPEQAHALAPWDGRIAAELAEDLSGPQADAEQRSRSDQVAQAAVRHDPLAVEAVATLGLNAHIRGDVDTAQRMYLLADKLSRRDLRTRLWMLEDKAAKGDIAGTLRQYDIALRTSGSADAILYPVLASAIADTGIREELARTLAAQPAWTRSFLTFASWNEAADPSASAALFRAIDQAGVPIPDSARAILTGRLLAAGLPDEAWDYYEALTPGADRNRSRDPRFTAALSQAAVFDWMPSDDSNTGLSAAIQPGAEGGIFDFFAPPSVGGILLKQTQLLPAGEYALTGHSIGLDQPVQSRPYWELRCSDGRSVGRVDMPNSVESGGVFRGRFTVPAGCPIQILQFVARPSNDLSGLSGQIDQVGLVPAG